MLPKGFFWKKENKSMSDKTIIDIILWLENNRKVEYKGRLLGLIDDEEFNKIIKDKGMQNQCFTKGTMPLSNITHNKAFDGPEGLDGLRMVVALRVKDDRIVAKRLFITEKLNMISFIGEDGETSINGEEGSWITLNEEEA